MQTFLATGDLALNARLIDWRRANKQIIESRQIGRAITDESYGWQNHPATNMWRGHIAGLMHYTKFFADVYSNGVSFTTLGTHGRDVTVYRKPSANNRQHMAWVNMQADHPDVTPDATDMPDWFLDPATLQRVTATHRSMLVRKAPEFYGRLWHATHDDYYWPV